jgi:hypothetical protein
MQYQPQGVMAGRVHQAVLAARQSHTPEAVVAVVAVELRELAAQVAVEMVLHQVMVLLAP